jgi:methylenetetrahydrofolate dehydrogenase (NADP+)/methenyltetrahydrofolate cyclohydrolase
MIQELKSRVDALYLEYIFPVLATLRLGEDPAAAAYEAELYGAAKAAGIKLRRYIMPVDLTEEDVAQLIREINLDPLLSAFLLLEPLPAHLDAAALKALIDPGKALEAAPPCELLSRVCDAAERGSK